jgi:DNA-binding NarL/FixJ family response regulator
MRIGSEDQSNDEMGRASRDGSEMQDRSTDLIYVQSYSSEQDDGDFLQLRGDDDAQFSKESYHNGNSIAMLHQKDAITIENIISIGNIRGRVIVVDQWGLLRGPLAGWLDAFNLDFQSIVVTNVKDAAEYVGAPVATAAILCAPPSANDNGWLDDQIASLRQGAADLPIVVIGDGYDPAGVDEMVANFDLRSYFPLTGSMALATAALHVVMAGGSYYPPLPAFTQAKLEPEARVDEAPHLTPRERMVFELLAHGMPNKIIAYRLDLSISTVKIHVHHIIRKLKVHNRTEAALWAREVHAANAAKSRSYRNDSESARDK